jgi:hypothetical protein
VYLSQNKQTSKQVKCQNNSFQLKSKNFQQYIQKQRVLCQGKKTNAKEQTILVQDLKSATKAKTEQQKATFLLNDPLIRSLDRKTTRKHTSHHYLIIYTKNTGNGGLKVLWWVLTTHTHSGKLRATEKRTGLVAT